METRFIPRGLQHLLCCPLKVLCLLLPSHDWEFTKGRHNLKAAGIAAYLLIVVSGGQYKKDGVENTRLKMRMKLHFSFWWKVKPMFLIFNKTHLHSCTMAKEKCAEYKWRLSLSLSWAGLGRSHCDKEGILPIISRRKNMSYRLRKHAFMILSIFYKWHYAFLCFKFGNGKILDCAKIMLNVLSASSVGDHSSNKVPISSSCSSLAWRYLCGGFSVSMISAQDALHYNDS